MAVCSHSSFEASLDINDLEDVLQLLKKCDFLNSKWMELGLKLGLKKNTLGTIEANNPRDVSRCLIECLSKWLERADDVDSKGGATWDSLSDALRSMDEIAVADKLDKEKPQVLALRIFDRHHSLLSESLSDPVSVARLLNAERVISTQVVNRIEAESGSTLNQRQILLPALREAIQANHTCLQSFAIVLLKVTGNVQLGQVILSNYGEYFPSNDEATLVKIEEGYIVDVVTSTRQTVTVEIPIHKSRSKEFTSLRMSLGRMMYNACKAIKEAEPELNDLKELVESCNRDLKPKLAGCSKVSNILSLVKEECSLIDVSLLEALVKEFNVKKAEKYIEEYKGILKEFLENTPITRCVRKKFDAVSAHPPLNCETITYVFDWRPDERMLKDITDILSESSGKLVKIRFIDTGYSIAVTCSFPYSLHGVLIARVMENLQLLIKNGLIKLTIGYWTIWEEDKTEEKEIEQEEQEVHVTESEKFKHEKLLELKDTIYQLTNVLSRQEKVKPVLVSLEEQVEALIHLEEKKVLAKVENSKRELTDDKTQIEADLKDREQFVSKLIKQKSKILKEKEEIDASLQHKKVVETELKKEVQETAEKYQAILDEHHQLEKQVQQEKQEHLIKQEELTQQLEEYKMLGQPRISQSKVKISLLEPLPEEKKFSFTLSIKGPDLSVPVSSLKCSLVPVGKGDEPIDTTVTTTSTHPGVYRIHCNPSTSGTHTVKVQVYDVELEDTSLVIPFNLCLDNITPVRTITELNSPWGVAVNNDGHVIVTERFSHHVTILDNEGKKVKSLGGPIWPQGVAITPDNLILVSDGNHRIQKISMDGVRIASVGEEGSGPLQFDYPKGIAISPITGQVYIAEKHNHRIQVLNPDLTFSHSFGSKGSASGQFKYPHDTAIDNQGLVYVTDHNNHRIQKFSPNGKFVAQFGSNGSGPGQLNYPFGITIDTAGTGLVYVSEESNHRVSVFTSDGVFVSSFGSEGSNIGQFNKPHGLTFNKEGLLCVCDYGNKRLVVYY